MIFPGLLLFDSCEQRFPELLARRMGLGCHRVSEDPANSCSFQHEEMASLDNPSAWGLAMDLRVSADGL